MFTGLVETVGTVVGVLGQSPRRLTVQSNLPVAEIRLGDSVAIDGCCLTVVAAAAAGLSFQAATETLERTTMGSVGVGTRVNLERALCLGDRLGGHLVAGHVDGLGIVRERTLRGSALYLGIEASPEVGCLTAARGCITVAGVSLTVTDVRDMTFWVGLIPHTLSVTNLEALAVADCVNLEADLLARYVQRLLQVQGAAALTGSGIASKEPP